MVSLSVVCLALRPRPCLGTSHSNGPSVSPPLPLRRRPTGTSLFRGSITRLSTSLSTLHAVPFERRCKTRLRCGAIRFPAGFGPAWEALRRFRPAFSPQASACSFVCLSLSFVLLLSGFCFRVFPAAMPLHGAKRGRGEEARRFGGPSPSIPLPTRASRGEGGANVPVNDRFMESSHATGCTHRGHEPASGQSKSRSKSKSESESPSGRSTTHTHNP